MKQTHTLLLVGLLACAPLSAQVSFSSQSVPVSGDYNICVVDMDGDHLDDIVSVSSSSIQILYQQEDGGFEQTVYSHAPVSYLPGWSIAAGDLNGNGFKDLVYGASSGASFMITNADGTAFSEFTDNQFIFVQRTNFVDIDNDGNLDVFLCHDVAPNVYYLNDGNGNLTRHQGGLGDVPVGGHYGSLWVDYNNDGLIDMFVAKCSGGGQGATAKFNELHKNNGDGTFTDVSDASGLTDPLQTWSSAWGDFDNDGFMDVFVGASTFSDGGHKLMKNNGDGTFSDVTAGSGFDTFNGTSIEHATYDFNNDGYLDIFGNDNKIFINNGDMTFTPVTVPFSAASIGDLNNDGFLDAFVNGTIYYNNGNSNNWVTVATKGVTSNPDGIGARVEVHSALGTQIRDVRSGEGFRHMSTTHVHVGLGQDTEIEKIVIKWPSGTVDEVLDPAINAKHVIEEGVGIVSVEDQVLAFLTVYPNPANDRLYIDACDPVAGTPYALYDLSGRAVRQGLFVDNSLDISRLGSGMYFLHLEIGGHPIKKQFIKR